MPASPLENDLPGPVRQQVRGYRWTRQTIGRSQAGVFRLDAPGKPILFLKVEPSGPLAELAGEAARLGWLTDRGVACPRVAAFAADRGHDWLLMTAVPGCDLVSLPPGNAVAAIGVMADALRRLHALDIRSCPFDHSLDHRIADARVRVEAGAVDTDDFDDERQGWSAEDAFARLLETKPSAEDLVVTHGDACMPNFIAEGDAFSGFVDCGRLGVADRHQDLALACWSIRYNLGEAWIEPFLQRYGGAGIDAGKLSYYRLLDEFF